MLRVTNSHHNLDISEVYFLKHLTKIFVFILLIEICFCAHNQYATYGWDFNECKCQ